MKNSLLALLTLLFGSSVFGQCTLDASFTWNISGSSLYGTNTTTGTGIYGTTYEWSANTLWDYDENSEFPMAGMPEIFLICLTVMGSSDSTLTDSLAWCSDWVCDTVSWDSTTLEISANDDLSWSVSPNPCDNEVFITSGKPLQNVVVFNLQGALIYSERFASGTLGGRVETASWQPGIYFVRLGYIDGQSVTRKLIVR